MKTPADETALCPFPYKAAIFDFDGTIADTDDIWNQIDRDFLAARGIEWTPDIGGTLATLGFQAGAEWIIERYGLDETPGEVMHEWNAAAGGAYAHDVVLRPGAAEVLAELRAAGVPLALATSNNHAVLETMAPRLDVYTLFDTVVCTRDVGATKRDPEVYYEAARRLGTDPADCLVFEDMLEPLLTAKRAGMAVCGIATDNPAQQVEEMLSEADYFIGGWEGLAELLGREKGSERL